MGCAVLLVIGLLLILLFAGVGLFIHILWLGLIVGLVLLVAHFVTGGHL